MMIESDRQAGEKILQRAGSSRSLMCRLETGVGLLGHCLCQVTDRSTFDSAPQKLRLRGHPTAIRLASCRAFHGYCANGFCLGA